ncbi:MAG TPA: cupin domain-containing protein [Methylomirabilota bacterium]|nr:cupin domain-containing protein [Methylomirabilota bacterium]
MSIHVGPSPLGSWFPDARALAGVRRRLGHRPIRLAARDRAWRAMAPGFSGAVALAAAGCPFHVVAARRVDRSADRRRLPHALAAGATVYFPQVHQVLPRVMRLMVALRVGLLGPGREECSFLFAVEGRGRTGLGLHHDGEVDAVWLQLEGRRVVTVGLPVPPNTPADLDERLAAPGADAGWSTHELPPGTLFYLPPRTPHRVVCHGRSLALSLTWARPTGRLPRRGNGLAWDVASGWAETLPPASRRWLWPQLPLLAGPVDPRRGTFVLATPAGTVRLPARAHALARRLALMAPIARATAEAADSPLHRLLEYGLLAPRDLPLCLIPKAPRALDGWHFV